MFGKIVGTIVGLGFLLTTLAGEIDPLLRKKLNQISPDDTLRVIVHLKAQADEATLFSIPKKERANYLQDFAWRNQELLLAYLEMLQGQSYFISAIEPLWVNNIVILTSNRRVIELIVQHPDVKKISENRMVHLPKLNPTQITSVKKNEIQWNINMIGAPKVWELGYRGKNQKIGFIDTGIDSAHPILKGGRLLAWIDIVDSIKTPYDDYSHGTHVVGIACGTDGYGVAPEADYMMAKPFKYGSASFEALHSAFQWYAEMGENAPRIISNSWGHYFGSHLEFWQDILNLQSLNIFCVFAIGNMGGPPPGVPGSFQTVLGVGAVGPDGLLAWFSSHGPAPDTIPWNIREHWLRPDWNFIKPDIVAPGDSIISSLPGNQYGRLDGTSMAAPHAAASAVLVLEKNPQLTDKGIYNLLLDNAFRYSPQSYPEFPNNEYGWGRLDIYRAIISQGVKEERTKINNNLKLSLYPNPLCSNQNVSIKYQIPNQSMVSLKIFDVNGRLIKTLFEKRCSAGCYTFYWQTQGISKGIYFCHLQTEFGQVSQKIVVLK